MTTDRVSDERLRELLTWLGDDTFAGFKRTCNLPVAEAKALVSELLALREAAADVVTQNRDYLTNLNSGAQTDPLTLAIDRPLLTSLKENHP